MVCLDRRSSFLTIIFAFSVLFRHIMAILHHALPDPLETHAPQTHEEENTMEITHVPGTMDQPSPTRRRRPEAGLGQAQGAPLATRG